MMWGKMNENGFWLATKPRRCFMMPFKGHDSIYIALERFRFRLVCRNLHSPGRNVQA
jgi:hypothetical protein